MVPVRIHPIRPILLILLTVGAAVMLSSCGNGPSRSSATEHTGSGGLMVGQSRSQVEASNTAWTVHASHPDSVGVVVVYRDYHWSWSSGFAHSAEYHHVTYDIHNQVVAWVSNSNPNTTRE